MEAIGIDKDGNKIKFECLGDELNCDDELLIELILPEGMGWVSCDMNLLTELILPEGVRCVYCSDNQLTHLIIPEGVTYVSCYDNNITHLTLPNSVKYLKADKEVLGLERYMGKVEIELE